MCCTIKFIFIYCTTKHRDVWQQWDKYTQIILNLWLEKSIKSHCSSIGHSQYNYLKYRSKHIICTVCPEKGDNKWCIKNKTSKRATRESNSTWWQNLEELQYENPPENNSQWIKVNAMVMVSTLDWVFDCIFLCVSLLYTHLFL